MVRRNVKNDLTAALTLTGDVVKIFKSINNNLNIFKSHKFKPSIAFSGKL